MKDGSRKTEVGRPKTEVELPSSDFGLPTLLSQTMMQKVKTMYNLMVERYAASPFTQAQAEVYRKILSLADECDSVETMTVRMQNEGYNSMPAVALMTDKLSAHYQAAVDNGLDEHAEIYKDALDNIVANPEDAYLTGFYDDIKKANIRYAKTLERLLACFDDFLHYEVKKEVLPNVKLRYDEWMKEGKQLSEVVRQKVFRNHFVCSDSFLERFANEYEDFVFGKQTPNDAESETEFEQAWNTIKNKDAERKVMAQTELPKFRLASAMCIAPSTADGDYEYIHVEFENR